MYFSTGIATAAIEMLGGEDMMNSSRKPDIMADAAYVILTKNSRSYTGNFTIDEDVLREVGINDFEEYNWVKGKYYRILRELLSMDLKRTAK